MESSFSKTLKLLPMAEYEEERETAAAEATAGNNGNAVLEEDVLELSLGLPVVPNQNYKKPTAEFLAVGKNGLNLNGQIFGNVQRIEFGNIDCLAFEDTKAKRVVQALRRQEAKKKREEKRRARSNGERNCGNEDMVWFERQGFEGRERDRERREKENESEFYEKFRKVNNGVDFIGGKLSLSPNTTLFKGLPVGGGQVINGGCALPCWAPGGAGLAVINNNNNGLQPEAAGGGFRPYQVERSGGGGKDGENRQSVSNCSRGSSSGISDYQSTSGRGSSSDAGSHSSHSQPRLSNPQIQSYPSQPEPRQNSFAFDVPHAQAECNSSSYQIDSTKALKKASPSAEGARSSNTNQEQSTPLPEHLSSETQACRDEKPISHPESPSLHPLKEVPKGDMGKPPKPPAQSSEALLLSQMPCVSTTGNGPNGKTINGFLYRYTKAEICIVCVCHGTSFSPAGFVEHAGGVNIEHPLKHIRVVPFTCG